MNCSTESPVKTHNINFALSDPKNRKLRVISEEAMDETCKDCVDLWEAIDTVRVIGDKSLSAEAQYDIKTAIDDIKLYVEHLIRDAQQKKAKAFALDKLDETSLFWLKDYCQKILPMKFREDQVDYFGKKGMTLHVDVVFYTMNGTLKKKIYFTCMQTADQDVKDVLALADNVLKKLQTDLPHINKVYCKSDNASCYHNSLGPEALYNLCKKYGIDLVRYDFNEPCKGKDQCDRESATAKTILRSYLHAGNNILTTEDIAKSLSYGYGVQSAEVCVASNDQTKTTLTGKKTKNFTLYHSYEFKESGVTAWRYFGIGEGVFIPFVGTSFSPTGFEVTRAFTKTEQKQRIRAQGKERKHRSLHNLFYCDEPGCAQIFEDQQKYELHCLRDEHDNDHLHGSIKDRIKHSYVSLMKISSPSSSTINAGQDESFLNKSMDIICAEYPVMEHMNKEGWALPVRNTFRYSEEQKQILYGLFIEGQESGKKVTPEEAVKEIRKKLPVDQFVKVKQVKQLFSRLASMAKLGKLDLYQQNEAQQVEEEEGEEDPEEEIWESCNVDIREQSRRICNSSADQSHSFISAAGMGSNLSDADVSVPKHNKKSKQSSAMSILLAITSDNEQRQQPDAKLARR